MKQQKISIIIPVYNVEQYLEKCIDSVLNQTISNLEIILVNDGSKDNSGLICDKYAVVDKRITVVHKQNGGLSDARNCGIKHSSGDYIIFLDSDDFLAPTFCEILLENARKYDADIVISGLKNYYEGDEVNYEICNGSKLSEQLTKEETYKRMFLQEKIDVNATAKLYKRSLFNDIEFPKGMLYEDIQIVDKIIESANIIVAIDYRGYYYLQRQNSIMYGKMSNKRLVLLEKTQELIKFISSKYPNIVDSIIKRHVYCSFHILGRSILDKNYNQISKTIRTDILKYKKNIFGQKIYSKKEKYATFLLMLGLPIYKIFWKIYVLIK